MAIIHAFGNPDLDMDALPLRLLPLLRERFPDDEFRAVDPNEEWEIPDPFIAIDTVVGLPEPHVFRSLEEFVSAPAVTAHDYDALFNLRYLAKLGKLGAVVVVGLPVGIEVTRAKEFVERSLGPLLERT